MQPAALDPAPSGFSLNWDQAADAAETVLGRRRTRPPQGRTGGAARLDFRRPQQEPGEGLPYTCHPAAAALADPSKSRCQLRTRTLLTNKGRPPHGTGGCGGTALTPPVCLIPGVPKPKHCRAQPWQCVADLVGAGASCSGEQARAHERRQSEPGQPDSEGSSHFPTVTETRSAPRGTTPSNDGLNLQALGRWGCLGMGRTVRCRLRAPAGGMG